MFHALETGMQVTDALLKAGISKEVLGELAAIEASTIPSIRICPWTQEMTRRFRVDTFDRNDAVIRRTQAAIFRTLKDGLERKGTQRISLGRRETDAGTGRVIELHEGKVLPKGGPVLLLDADADERIVEAIAPGTPLVRIDVKPQAEIVQVADRALSRNWLLDQQKGRDRRNQVARVIRKEVERANGAGVLEHFRISLDHILSIRSSLRILLR